MLQAISAALEKHGFDASAVEVGPEPGPQVCDLDKSIDLLVLGPKTKDWLRWGETQERNGIVVSPRPSSTGQMRNRTFAQEMLRRSGFAVPLSFSGTPQELTLLFHQSVPPLPVIIKPGHRHGVGVSHVRTKGEWADALTRLATDEAVVVEEEVYGTHHTVYFVGDRQFAFDRPPFGGERTERPNPSNRLLATERLMALQELSGMRFGKLDIVCGPQCQWVVDVGVFPKFLNVPDAEQWIASAISEQFRLVRDSRTLPAPASPEPVSSIHCLALSVEDEVQRGRHDLE